MKIYGTILRAPEGAAGGEGQAQAGAGTGGEPWYGTIADEGLKTTAAKFESRDKLLEAVGYKAPDWREQIKDEEARKIAKDSPDLDHFAKRTLEMRQRIGKGFQPPGKDAKPEDIAAYRKAMGVPEAPDKYEWPDLPNGQPVTDEVKASRDAWGKRFHELGVSAPVAKELARIVNEDQAAYEASLKAADKKFADETEAKLKDKWKGDEFERNTKASERAIVNLAERSGIDVQELRHMELKNGRFLLDDPNVRQLFAAVGLEMTEGNLGPALTDSERGSMKGQLDTIRSGIAAAQAKGDDKEANRLYQAEQALVAKMQGSKSIVGSGRAV